MEIEINWSEGPAEAIGFAKGNGGGCNSIWYRRYAGSLQYCTDDNQELWMDSFCVPDNVVWREAATESWPASGLPPIGTECEAFNDHLEEWIAVKIIDQHESVHSAVCREIGTDKLWWSDSFRPVKTAEQTKAEERADAIDRMVQFFMNYYGNPKGAEQYLLICRSLHDAGYRKIAEPQ